MPDELITAYDELADVFYVSVGQPDPDAESASDEFGLIWRTSEDGRCTGVTVQRFSRWFPHLRELEKVLSRNLHLPKKAVHERMPEPA